MNPAEAVLGIELLDLTAANAVVIEKVRQIRNEPGVRKNMYTDHQISVEEHAGWLASLSRSINDRAFFAVLYKGEVIGGVGYSALSRQHRRADWAYYLSSGVKGSGLGSALEFKFLDYMFGQDLVFKLNCEVIDWNAAVVKLHKRFGFLEEGTRRAHVHRDGTSHDVVLLGITKLEWLAAREKLTQRLFAGV